MHRDAMGALNAYVRCREIINKSKGGRWMRYLTRWWEGMGKAERITAMSLAAGALIAIVNSTVWAIASSYMVRQRTLAEIERARNYVTSGEQDSAQRAAYHADVPADEQFATPSI
jgi:hypothetical protein